jgi:rhamnulokinase
VIAGPVEATAIGNVLVQAIALKDIESLAALRRTVRDSFPVTTYKPRDRQAWEEAFGRFQQLTK